MDYLAPKYIREVNNHFFSRNVSTLLKTRLKLKS